MLTTTISPNTPFRMQIEVFGFSHLIIFNWQCLFPEESLLPLNFPTEVQPLQCLLLPQVVLKAYTGCYHFLLQEPSEKHPNVSRTHLV